MVRFFGAYVDRESVIPTAVCVLVQKNVARGAFRSRTTVSQDTTTAKPYFLWASCLCGPGILCFNNGI